MECEVCKKPSNQECSACHSANYCSQGHQRKHWQVHKKDCTPIVLRESPALGRHWVASRNLKAGTLILKESPILRSPAWPTSNFGMWVANENPLEKAQCLTCGVFLSVVGNDVYRCSKCTWPLCGPECERNPNHLGNECAVFKMTQFTFPPPRHEITPKRIDWAVTMIRLGRIKITNPQRFQEIMNLQREPNIPADAATLDGLKSAIDAINYYFNNGALNFLRLSDDEMSKYLWIMKLNGMNCSQPDSVDEDKITCRQDCLYLKVSMLANSCSPNCAQSQIIPGPDYVMWVRTAIPVKKGQPLTIAYCGSDCFGTADRQRELREKFYFVCKCDRCLDPTELRTYSSSVTCLSCLEEKDDNVENTDPNLGYMSPEDPLAIDDSTTNWKCNQCDSVVPASSVVPRINRLGRIIKNAHNSNQAFCRKLIEENSGRVLHPNHWIIQMAASCILSKYFSPEVNSPAFDMEEVRRLAFFRLKIQDTLNPGISFVRAMYQRDCVLLIFPKLFASSFESNISEETKERFRECLKMLTPVIEYYRLFKESLTDAENNVRSLMSIKESIGSLHFLS
ncbi:unnamed protein product [Allacma fusca]|uniref:Protein msta n=1 Tax=Allacma fusca TaxID=39272 RepID=A0A8J2P0I1_9HEXA|nr:unnamed protein product [Allacma fusca]